jgi:hypothetical protein
VPVGPVIAHIPLADPQPSPAPWAVTAAVTDNFQVASVNLRWRRVPQAWQNTAMQTNASGTYQSAIPAPGLLGDQYEYRIEATDAAGYLTQTPSYLFSVAYPITDVSPTSVSNRVLVGVQVQDILCITNRGNATYDWTVRAVQVGFQDNVEKGTNGWSHSGTNDLWHIDSARSFSASHAWYCGQDGSYSDSMHARLALPALLLGTGATLTFRHWMDSEILALGSVYTWDAGIIEISTNAGISYQQLTPVGGYSHKMVGHGESPWPNDTPCYGGTGGWQRAAVDLSSFAGRNALIRFHFGSDGLTVAEGWYIDDVRITPLSGTNEWLRFSATNGSLAVNQSACVTATMDSATLASGADWFAYAEVRGNDPVTPCHKVPVTLSVRSVPHVEILHAGQATNGSGLVTVSNLVADADGEPCSVEMSFSADAGATWHTAWVESAAMSFGGAPGVQSLTTPQVAGVPTTNGLGPATNALSIVWRTGAGVPPLTLCTQTVVRIRVWDGFYWGAVTSAAFLVDNDGPLLAGLPVISSHLPGEWSTNRAMHVAWGAATDGDGVGVAGYRLSLAQPPGPASSNSAQPGLSATVVAPQDGTNWHVSVRGFDGYGNTGNVVTTGPYWIDATPPSATMATVSIIGGTWYVVGTTVTGSWSGFTDALSGVAGYYVALTNGGGTIAGTPITGATTGVLSGCRLDATNGFHVWAYDAAGGIGQATAVLFMAFNPVTDWDLDGMNSADEAVAGTDPGNGHDVLAMGVATSQPPVLILEWEGKTGRWYSVDRVTNLFASPWDTMPNFSNRPGTGGRMAYTSDVGPVSPQFYRITVSP